MDPCVTRSDSHGACDARSKDGRAEPTSPAALPGLGTALRGRPALERTSRSSKLMYRARECISCSRRSKSACTAAWTVARMADLIGTQRHRPRNEG